MAKNVNELAAGLTSEDKAELYALINAERRAEAGRRKDALANFLTDLRTRPDLFYISYADLRAIGLHFDGSGGQNELSWFIGKVKNDVGGNVKKITQLGLNALNATRDYAGINVDEVQFRSTAGKPAAALVFPHRAEGGAAVFVKGLIKLLDAPWEEGVRNHLETSLDAEASMRRVLCTPELRELAQLAIEGGGE